MRKPDLLQGRLRPSAPELVSSKLGMSQANGVTLVTVTWEDLSHKDMSPKIPDSLPKRAVDPKDPFIKTLEEESARYTNAIRKAMRDWAPPEA